MTILIGLGQILAVWTPEARLVMGLLFLVICVYLLQKFWDGTSRLYRVLGIVSIAVVLVVTSFAAAGLVADRAEPAAKPAAKRETSTPSPAASASPSASPSPSVYTVSSSTDKPEGAMFLADLGESAESSDNVSSLGEFDLNGVAYEKSVRVDAGCTSAEFSATGRGKWVDFTFEPSYSSFQAIIGLDDSSSRRVESLSYRIFVGGFEVDSGTIYADGQERLNIPIVGARQLRLLVDPSDYVSCSSVSRDGDIIWGNAVLLP
ncbi:NPCBM/NEW2 domain-containing protein [Nonomuraea sp. NPDC050663]|uniref:NPCBM/NEW2 domain-containing protein n=1 Tax=Nonomuraea sp. NPDC050663 TaxID=3364370 RepID=UPI003790DF6E